MQLLLWGRLCAAEPLGMISCPIGELGRELPGRHRHCGISPCGNEAPTSAGKLVNVTSRADLRVQAAALQTAVGAEQRTLGDAGPSHRAELCCGAWGRPGCGAQPGGRHLGVSHLSTYRVPYGRCERGDRYSCTKSVTPLPALET
ncbi:hypothetical protein NDU88_008071 [Pleurodeles waltl]|uniref:Uncharacterized protein n=1 Tax=Pleurodeles waltl TaxID=8319 RepID=A0AAV7NXU7_PLEWA|nr:hypothetical protein NDU88_008071 [Pleurodeles waltl]